MAFAVTLILENITARIIFWHSNVIASTRTCVAAPSFICVLDKSDRFEKSDVRGFFCCCFQSVTPTPSCWTKSLQLLGHTINVSIIECLTKKGAGIKNFMTCHYAPPPSPHLSSHFFPQRCLASSPGGSAAMWRRLSGAKCSRHASVDALSYTGALKISFEKPRVQAMCAKQKLTFQKAVLFICRVWFVILTVTMWTWSLVW